MLDPAQNTHICMHAHYVFISCTQHDMCISFASFSKPVLLSASIRRHVQVFPFLLQVPCKISVDAFHLLGRGSVMATRLGAPRAL